MEKQGIRFISYSWDYLSRDSTREYKGLFAIIIFLYHMAYNIGFDAIKPFVRGSVVVAFFFFFSGYGSMFNYIRNCDYSHNYIKRRVMPILVEYLIVSVLCWAAYSLMGSQYRPVSFWNNMVLYGEPIVRYSWYVVIILFFYLSFFALIKLTNKKFYVILGMVIVWLLFSVGVFMLNWGRHWYDTSILFIIGMIWAWNEDRIKEFVKNHYCASFFICLFLLCATLVIKNNIFTVGRKNIAVFTVSEVLLVILFFVVTMKVSFSIPPLRVFGDMSLEIYICQGLVFDFLEFIGLDWPLWLKVIFCIGVTMLVSWPLYTMRRWMIRKLRS